MDDINNLSLLIAEAKEIEFLDMDFDFDISPNHFIAWLIAEGEHITGDYRIDVVSMCEYACLYITMMLSDKELEGDMKVYYGEFNFMGHFWIGYLYKGQEYFIDLTLKQFKSNAPKLAISKYMNEKIRGSYSFSCDGQPIKEYLKETDAFKFYTNPKTMETPTIPSFLAQPLYTFDNLKNLLL